MQILSKAKVFFFFTVGRKSRTQRKSMHNYNANNTERLRPKFRLQLSFCEATTLATTLKMAWTGPTSLIVDAKQACSGDEKQDSDCKLCSNRICMPFRVTFVKTAAQPVQSCCPSFCLSLFPLTNKQNRLINRKKTDHGFKMMYISWCGSMLKEVFINNWTLFYSRR